MQADALILKGHLMHVDINGNQSDDAQDMKARHILAERTYPPCRIRQ